MTGVALIKKIEYVRTNEQVVMEPPINIARFEYGFNLIAPTLFQLLKVSDIETARTYMAPVSLHFPDIIKALDIQAAAVGSVPFIERVILYYGYISTGTKKVRSRLVPKKVSDILHGKLLKLEGVEATLHQMLKF